MPVLGLKLSGGCAYQREYEFCKCLYSLTFERVYDFFSRRREGGRPEFFWCIYVHETCFCRTLRGQDKKLQIWKQAVWQFLLNASFHRCTAAMSDLAHVFLKHLPRGPKTADYLQADPNVLYESFEPLLTDLACRLQEGRASKKKLEVSLLEPLVAASGLEHMYNERRQATSGAKLQPPVQRIVKAISSSSLEIQFEKLLSSSPS